MKKIVWHVQEVRENETNTRTNSPHPLATPLQSCLSILELEAAERAGYSFAASWL